jgi:hypothetical protein
LAIENTSQLTAAVAEASRLIQEISDYANENPAVEHVARVRFPIGFLPTADQHRQELRFVPDVLVRRNLSYALMTHDVLRWMVTRTTITGQARDMLIKEAICLIGSVCETLTIWKGQQGLGSAKSFAHRVERLRGMEVIDARAETDLLWVWEIRCREHIAGVALQEWDHYTMDQWRRAVRAYRTVRDGLAKWRAIEP